MNQLVCERRIEGRFMTICMATWQKGRRKLRIANAGQSQPLLWKDGRCDRVNLTGFPLGIFDDVRYDEWGVTLHRGDILVLYSDGMTEAASPDGQLFGSHRLCQAVAANAARSASELADRLLSEVDHFSQGAALADDRTLVILKVQ
jgi:serine phosphatase RsbU (regulator of sigma subunit)